MKSTMLTMVVSLAAIASVMGACLGIMHDLTSGPIQQAKEKAFYDALECVMPPMFNPSFGKEEEVSVGDDKRHAVVIPAYCNDSLCGVAVESWTMDGFSGEIVVMVGFSPSGHISGYQVLSHSETPGLGAKVNDWFRLRLGSDDNGHNSIMGAADYLQLRKDGGTVDGITAATITSRAFLQAVNRARDAFSVWMSENGHEVHI